MKVNNLYIKDKLRHVYWLNGGACAGKTTMTRKFIDDLGFRTLDIDVKAYDQYVSTNSAIRMANSKKDWEQMV